jgi:hypothetical protein
MDRPTQLMIKYIGEILNGLREKLLEYKPLPSLQSYLIVDSEFLWVKHFYREGNTWQQESSNLKDFLNSAHLATLEPYFNAVGMRCGVGKNSLHDTLSECSYALVLF